MSTHGVSRTAFLTRWAYAHRGLHGPGISENGLPAFGAALEAGHGVECDIRLSRDGTPFVFHDATLARMTGERGTLAAMDASALAALRLVDGSPLPRLVDLLALAAARAPLLLELKVDRPIDAAPLARAVAAAIAGYRGPLAIMSFSPLAVRWFARHAPAVARGLVMSESYHPSRTPGLDLRRSRPDFLAYDVRDLPAPLLTFACAPGVPVLSWPLLTWTVRTARQLAIAREHADAIIFERPAYG